MVAKLTLLQPRRGEPTSVIHTHAFCGWRTDRVSDRLLLGMCGPEASISTISYLTYLVWPLHNSSKGRASARESRMAGAGGDEWHGQTRQRKTNTSRVCRGGAHGRPHFFCESRILTCLTYTSRRGSQHRGQTAEQEDTKARKAKLQRPRTAAQGSLSHKQQAKQAKKGGQISAHSPHVIYRT
jgi:hypothetical protein